MLLCFLLTTEMKGLHGAVGITRDRTALKVEKTNSLAPQPLLLHFLLLVTHRLFLLNYFFSWTSSVFCFSPPLFSPQVQMFSSCSERGYCLRMVEDSLKIPVGYLGSIYSALREICRVSGVYHRWTECCETYWYTTES